MYLLVSLRPLGHRREWGGGTHPGDSAAGSGTAAWVEFDQAPQGWKVQEYVVDFLRSLCVHTFLLFLFSRILEVFFGVLLTSSPEK